LGYSVTALAIRLREILGLKRAHRVVMVGAGRIGGALAQYPGFRQRGFHVSAIYDRDAKKIGSRWNGLVVRDIRHLESDLKKEPTDIAIVVVPADAAQDVVDRLVQAGVKAILNFAPVQPPAPSSSRSRPATAKTISTTTSSTSTWRSASTGASSPCWSASRKSSRSATC